MYVTSLCINLAKLWSQLFNQILIYVLQWRCFYKSESVSCLVMSDSLWPHGSWHTRLLCPWNSPEKNIGVGCHSLLQWIFLSQGSNPGLPHCRQSFYCLSHQGSLQVSISQQFSYFRNSAASLRPLVPQSYHFLKLFHTFLIILLSKTWQNCFMTIFWN